MPRNPFTYTQQQYDNLVKQIFENLKNLLDDFIAEKKNQIELRDTQVHKLHAEQKGIISIRRSELDTRALEARKNVSTEGLSEQIDEILSRITALQKEFDELIIREYNMDRLELKKLTNEDPARLNEEIGIIQGLLDYMKDKAGNKGNKRTFNTDAMYARVEYIYNKILTKQEELALKRAHFDPLEKEIERRAKEIINAIIKDMEFLDKNLPKKPPEIKPTDSQGKVKADKIFNAVREAEKLLERMGEWFLRAYDILKDLRDVAESKATNVSQLGKKRSRALALLRRLRRMERKEQRRASVRKLKKKLKPILEDRLVPVNLKHKIDKILEGLKVWEADWLVTTVRGLGERLKKGKKGIDWDEVIKYIDRVTKDTQAVIAEEKRLKEELERVRENEEQQKINLENVRRVEMENVQRAQQEQQRKAEAAEAERRRIAEEAERVRKNEEQQKINLENVQRVEMENVQRVSQRKADAAKAEQIKAEVQRQRLARRLDKSRNRPNFRGDKAERKRIAEEAIKAKNDEAIRAAEMEGAETKGERSQRSKDTNLQGGGRRGFKSNPKESGGKKRTTPRHIRMKPHDRGAERRRRQRGEEEDDE